MLNLLKAFFIGSNLNEIVVVESQTNSTYGNSFLVAEEDSICRIKMNNLTNELKPHRDQRKVKGGVKLT